METFVVDGEGGMASAYFVEEMKRRGVQVDMRPATARSFHRATRGHATPCASRHRGAAGARRYRD
eukprot:363759-Pyramimonas_sp.AAC.1